MQNPISKLRLTKFLVRGARDQRGVSAVAFAISFAVLTPMALGIFDVYENTEQRGKLQDALDAATLYAARSTGTTNTEI
jgi:Flp pilus assembly protein TadG